MRNNPLGQCPTPLSMAGAYPASLTPPNSTPTTPTTPTESISMERPLDAHVRRERVSGETFREPNSQGWGVRKMKRKSRAILYGQNRTRIPWADKPYVERARNMSIRQYDVDEKRNSSSLRGMSDILAVVERVRRARDGFRASFIRREE
jgi:hypothetical protein